MKTKEIKTMYEKLKKIQSLLWRSDDLMDQDTLFELQELVAGYALHAAKKEKKTQDLIQTFPWLYQTKQNEYMESLRL